MYEPLVLIFIVVLGASVIPLLARKLRLPSSALEIVLGIALFHSVFNEMPQWMELLKELGFIYLMFIAGMELNLRSLLKEKRTGIIYLLFSLLPFIILPPIFYLLGSKWYYGVVVSVTAAGIAIPVLKETGFIKTPVGKHIVGLALSGELITIGILTAIDVYHLHGFSLAAGIQFAKLSGLLLLAILFLKIVYMTAWWHPKWVEKIMESDDPIEEGMRVIIAIAFAGAVVAHSVGVEAILGSFMAGVIFNYVFKSKGKFEDKVNGIGFGFFIPFFFIGVGAGFDLSVFTSWSNIELAVLLAVVLWMGNTFPFILAPWLKLGYKDGFKASLLLSTPLSMIVVAGELGMTMNLLNEEVYSGLILTAILSSLIYPLIFKALSKTPAE